MWVYMKRIFGRSVLLLITLKRDVFFKIPIAVIIVKIWILYMAEKFISTVKCHLIRTDFSLR